MIGLTPRAAEALGFIAEFQQRSGGISPTLDEIGEGIGLTSRSTAQGLLCQLEERGRIRRLRNRRRAIELLQPAPKLRVVAVFEPTGPGARAYTGPYPILSHRTCAEWGQGVTSSHASNLAREGHQDHA